MVITIHSIIDDTIMLKRGLNFNPRELLMTLNVGTLKKVKALGKILFNTLQSC